MTHPRHPRPPVDPAALNPPDSGTCWTNLGYWPGATDYPAAARALASRVGIAARLTPDDVVIDMACGFGDSLRLWVEEFGVRHVIGVEPAPDVVARAKARVAEWGLEHRITVLATRAEDVQLNALAPNVTAVVCVDAAYHIPHRDAWLGRLIRQLPRGGRLGIAHLTFAAHASQSWRVRLAATVLGIPSENLTSVDPEALVTGNAATVISHTHVGGPVLDGFVQAGVGRGLAPHITRALLHTARRHRWVDYEIVGFQCQGAPPF